MEVTVQTSLPMDGLFLVLLLVLILYLPIEEGEMFKEIWKNLEKSFRELDLTCRVNFVAEINVNNKFISLCQQHNNGK